MHHEKSYKFSDCDGKVANYYVSKLISGGTVEGFLEAINCLLYTSDAADE